MRFIEADSANEVYKQICQELIYRPEHIAVPRGGKIHEIVNFTFRLNHPIDKVITLPERNLSYRYLAGELLFYFSGNRTIDMISQYSKFWERIAEEDGTVNSAYGYRLLFERDADNGLTQFEYARQQLINSKNSKKAIMMVYKNRDARLQCKDTPCTMFLQYMIRNDKLCLFVTMRSNDVWFGVSYDLPFFAMMLEKMYVSLLSEYPSLRLGYYEHTSKSMHVYDRNFEAVEICANAEKCESEIQLVYTQGFEDELPKLLTMEEQLRETGWNGMFHLTSQTGRTMYEWLRRKK